MEIGDLEIKFSLPTVLLGKFLHTFGVPVNQVEDDCLK